MGTFIEFFITALITFSAGFLFLKYKPGVKYKVKRRKAGKFSADLNPMDRKMGLRKVYRDYSPKFIVILLVVMTFFSSVLYLAERGIIILKW